MEFEKATVQTAMAVRVVMGLREMGTMCAQPVEVRCVSCGVGELFGASGDGGLGEDENKE